uniref:Uncharacterized protein n=1 Tax=Cyprinus carpio TaxID=7962 RepID=A0A8C2EE90_CYPCA
YKNIFQNKVNETLVSKQIHSEILPSCLQIVTKDPLNPLKQKKGNLCYLSNVFPHEELWSHSSGFATGYFFASYSPCSSRVLHQVCSRGEVIRVKVLGSFSFSFCDENEGKSQRLLFLVDTEDIRRLKPGFPEPENQFAFDGEFKNRDFTIKTVKDTHSFWKTDAGELNLPYSDKQTQPQNTSAPLQETRLRGFWRMDSYRTSVKDPQQHRQPANKL